MKTQNTPPKYVLNPLNSCDYSEHEDETVFENSIYKVVSKEQYYALYDKRESRYKYRDTYVTLRDCKKDLAIKIAEGLTALVTSSHNES